jgi:hypothetical protein
MSASIQVGRTYNQNHLLRIYAPGKRRFSIYWTWSYPWEANRDLTELDNRFSSMTEVRRVAWPSFEGCEWDKMNFLQGIAGTLELFHRSTLAFQQIVGETTGHPVAIYQRIDQAGYKLPIDERVLADTDTLMVFGLDHLVSEQEAGPAEIDAIREWLKREGTCLLLAPHHDVGFTSDMKQRQMEYKHHGDELVPRQQRFGQYTRSLMKGLDVPVLNQFASAGRSRGNQGNRAFDHQSRAGQAWLTERCDHVQLSSAPAPLCADDWGHEINSSAGRPARRSVPAAPVHSGWQSGIQHLSLDASRRQKRRPYPARGLHQLHDLVWRHRKLGAILEQYGEDVRRSVWRHAGRNAERSRQGVT